jgi:hypothetical protein
MNSEKRSLGRIYFDGDKMDEERKGVYERV